MYEPPGCSKKNVPPRAAIKRQMRTALSYKSVSIPVPKQHIVLSTVGHTCTSTTKCHNTMTMCTRPPANQDTVSTYSWPLSRSAMQCCHQDWPQIFAKCQHSQVSMMNTPLQAIQRSLRASTVAPAKCKSLCMSAWHVMSLPFYPLTF